MTTRLATARESSSTVANRRVRSPSAVAITHQTMTRKVMAAVIHPVSIANCHGATKAVPTETTVPKAAMHTNRSRDGAPRT
jgi:hypothetical protein